MSSAEYIIAVHAALMESGFYEKQWSTDAKPITEAYGRCLMALQELEPPADLASEHGDILRALRDLSAIVASVNSLKELTDVEQLRHATQAGADGFRRLQSEADRLGLGIQFR